MIGPQVRLDAIKVDKRPWMTPATIISFITLRQEGLCADMKVAIFCLYLASAASAAPSFFHYLPHLARSRQQVPPTQVKSPLPVGQPLPQAGAYSVEIIYPHTFPGAAGPAQFPSQGFIKYSLPHAPGRQSVEVYYPYDFSQQRVLPFDFPPQQFPQHNPSIGTFDPNLLPSQDPLPSIQQDTPQQANEVPVNV